MTDRLRRDAEAIMRGAIKAVLPEEAVRRALSSVTLTGRVTLISVGKAAWRMARAAMDACGQRVVSGVVITKYGHAQGALEGLKVFEAGHPISDHNTLIATQAVIDAVTGLSENDTVLFLLSGGGSALFEKPLLPLDEYRDICDRLLRSGADITEINTIRKRLSEVKGGGFALMCRPARVEAIILSDVLGDPLDMIASGPVTEDSATADDALAVIRKYGLTLSPQAMALMTRDMPKSLLHVHAQVTGSVRQLCAAAMKAARALGYDTVVATDSLDIEARQAGALMAEVARTHDQDGKKRAILFGGETVVHCRGQGLGGRCQEAALSAARALDGCQNAAVFAFGSDGTDGPTDAAGGYADGDTCNALKRAGIDVDAALENNDAYHALKACGGLLMTGPTSTNVNDLYAILIG